MLKILLSLSAVFVSFGVHASSMDRHFERPLTYDGPWTYKVAPPGLSESDRFWSQNELNAVRSSELVKQVYPMLPNKFAMQMAGFPEYRSIIAGIHLAIAGTPTGQSLCQKATGGDEFALDELFGVQCPAAKAFQRYCTPTDQAVSNNVLRRNYSSSRYFYFLFYDKQPPGFEGWTSKLNATIIAMGPKTRTEAYLVRTLTHELAIKMDDKNNLAAKANLSPYYQGPKTCEIMLTMRNPYVRHAFATIRAARLEEQILKEMYIPSVPAFAGTCTENFLKAMKAVLPLSPMFELDHLLYENSMTKECSAAAARSNSVRDIVQLIEGTPVIDRGVSYSLCEFLSAPSLGNSKMTVYSNGPRPNIGTGTGNTINVDDLQSSLNQSRANISFQQDPANLPPFIYPAVPATIRGQ